MSILRPFALLFAVLSRSMAGGDTTDTSFQRRLTEQAVQGLADH
jgi:hypothetical protein